MSIQDLFLSKAAASIKETVEIDEQVRKVLAAWAKERDSEIGRMNLRRAKARLSLDQRKQLVERLAEISLGLLHILDYESTTASKR